MRKRQAKKNISKRRPYSNRHMRDRGYARNYLFRLRIAMCLSNLQMSMWAAYPPDDWLSKMVNGES